MEMDGHRVGRIIFDVNYHFISLCYLQLGSWELAVDKELFPRESVRGTITPCNVQVKDGGSTGTSCSLGGRSRWLRRL